tara:strand:- start:467 stop:787 length:321 start_codon:yes stop_codon:yes gene_type:complete
MALTETTVIDSIKVVHQYNIEVEEKTTISRDGVEVTTTTHRKVLVPGSLDKNEALVPLDISGEDPSVQAICNAAWTTSTLAAYTTYLKSLPPRDLALEAELAAKSS